MDSHPERRMYVTKTELTSRVLRVDIGSADGNYSGWAVSGVDINFDDSDLEGMVASIIHRVCPDSPVHAEIVATTPGRLHLRFHVVGWTEALARLRTGDLMTLAG